jgi:hypothetical protein
VNVITRAKRRTAISTAPVVPIWRPTAEGYALAAKALERSMYYRLLPDHSVQPILGENAQLEWAYTFEKTTRPLLATDVDGWCVSTIFLGFDHAFMDGPPELFETMVFTAATKVTKVFGRERKLHGSVDQRRYATYAQAMQGHDGCVTETRAIVANLNKLKGQADEG